MEAWLKFLLVFSQSLCFLSYDFQFSDVVGSATVLPLPPSSGGSGSSDIAVAMNVAVDVTGEQNTQAIIVVE